MQPDIVDALREIETFHYHYLHHDDDDYHSSRRLRALYPRNMQHGNGYGHGHGYGHADESDDVAKLLDRLQSMHISREPTGPFGVERNLGGWAPRIATSSMASNPNLGFSLSSTVPYPYRDSNALNLRSPATSSSSYGYLHNGVMGNRGSICLVAKDQQGCRLLQGMFDEGKQHVDFIFAGVIAHIGELMMDQFANYLMQKLFEVCSDDQRTKILLVLTEDPSTIFRISLDCHGTRAVQKLIETLKNRNQIAVVMAALRPGLVDLMKDINGNHVIQHCLTCFRPEDIKVIFDVATNHCVEIATHRHGCCVLQLCIGCSTGEVRENLVANIASNGLKLAQDAFGNYVIQCIIGLRSPSANAILASQFAGNFIQLSTQKFSSNVVERCFKEFREDYKANIVHELLSMSQFERLLHHPFANYVIQSALLNTKGTSYSALVEAIRPHAAALRTSPYCKRIFSLLSKKSRTF